MLPWCHGGKLLVFFVGFWWVTRLPQSTPMFLNGSLVGVNFKQLNFGTNVLGLGCLIIAIPFQLYHIVGLFIWFFPHNHPRTLLNAWDVMQMPLNPGAVTIDCMLPPLNILFSAWTFGRWIGSKMGAGSFYEEKGGWACSGDALCIPFWLFVMFCAGTMNWHHRIPFALHHLQLIVLLWVFLGLYDDQCFVWVKIF